MRSKYFKTILLKSLLLYLIGCSSCYADNFKVTPIILNFKGVTVKDSITVAYADLGSVLISRDDNSSWEQKRIFDGGEIVNLFINGGKITAFNDRGKVASSTDLGRSWQLKNSFNDSILAVVEIHERYFIRMRNRLIKVSKNYDIESEVYIESPPLYKINTYYIPTYKNSLLMKDSILIVEFDSSKFVRFDSNLNQIDTLDMLSLVDPGSYKSGYRIFYDSGYIYFKISYQSKSKLSAAVFRTKDFSNIEKFADCETAADLYNVFNGKYYPLNPGISEISLNDSTKLSNNNISDYFREAVLNNDKLYISGERKLLQVLNLKDSSLRVISDYSSISFRNPPDRIDENAYFFYSDNMPLYKSSNDGITILPVIDKTKPSYEKFSQKYKIHNSYFDDKSNVMFFIGEPYLTNQGVIWRSTDLGVTFDSTFVEHLYYQGNQPFLLNAFVKRNIQIRDDEFITSSGYSSYQDTIFSSIITFKEEGSAVKYVLGKNIIFNHVYSKDTSTYLAHCCNPLDGTSMVAYSDNAGSSWETIHQYPINETIGDIYDIETLGKEYLALVHYDYTNNPFLAGAFLDVVDKKTNQLYRIASWGSNTDPDYGLYGIAVDSDGDKVYISFEDTLFVTNDLFNKDHWQYYLLPETGRIARPLKKFTDKFYCIYTDKNNPYGKSIYWIKPLDSLHTNVEEVEKMPYLFVYPPFPLPASDEIRVKLFWDTSLEMAPDNISIYNIFGEKIPADNQIRIDKLNMYSGYLKWDCTSAPNGIYLIRIKHGTRTRLVKVIVSR